MVPFSSKHWLNWGHTLQFCGRGKCIQIEYRDNFFHAIYWAFTLSQTLCWIKEIYWYTIHIPCPPSNTPLVDVDESTGSYTKIMYWELWKHKREAPNSVLRGIRKGFRRNCHLSWYQKEEYELARGKRTVRASKASGKNIQSLEASKSVSVLSPAVAVECGCGGGHQERVREEK